MIDKILSDSKDMEEDEEVAGEGDGMEGDDGQL